MEFETKPCGNPECKDLIIAKGVTFKKMKFCKPACYHAMRSKAVPHDCIACKKPLVRRATEPNNEFNNRLTCGRSCAGSVRHDTPKIVEDVLQLAKQFLLTPLRADTFEIYE